MDIKRIGRLEARHRTLSYEAYVHWKGLDIATSFPDWNFPVNKLARAPAFDEIAVCCNRREPVFVTMGDAVTRQCETTKCLQSLLSLHMISGRNAWGLHF